MKFYTDRIKALEDKMDKIETELAEIKNILKSSQSDPKSLNTIKSSSNINTITYKD